MNPFLTFAWAYSCVKHHPDVKEGKAAVFYKDGRAAALFPVFHPKNKGDYAGVLIRRGYEHDGDIVRFVDEVCRVERLYPYPKSDGVIDPFFLEHFQCEPHHKSSWRADLSLGYDSYFQSLSKKFAWNVRYYRRKIEKDLGPVTFQFSLDDRNARKEVLRFLKIHSLKWGKRWVSMRSFLVSFSQMMGTHFWPCFLRVGQEDLYSCLIFQVRDTAYFLLSGFNTAFQKYSVGTLLLDAIIQHSCSRGLQVFDFLKGDDFYKNRFRCGELKRYRITAMAR